MEVLGLLSHDPDLDNILPQKLACAPPVSWGLPRRGHSPGGTEEGGDVSPGGEDDNTTPPSLKSVGRLESQADRTTALLEPTGAPCLMKTPPGELPSQGRSRLYPGQQRRVSKEKALIFCSERLATPPIEGTGDTTFGGTLDTFDRGGTLEN